jgi:ELWxxDGT repeat protein
MKKGFVYLLFWYFFLYLPVSLSAQTLSLVKDVNTNPASIISDSYPRNDFCKCGSYIFFSVENEFGREIWKTDGTTEGTSMVKDIYKGNKGGGTSVGACLNSKMIFTGEDDSGAHPWITDGTNGGTTRLVDLTEINSSILPGTYIPFKNKMFFTSYSSDYLSTLLWTTDGTSTNTTSFTTIPTGQIYYQTNSEEYIYLFVTDYLASSPDEQFKIWRTDGTAEGTESIFSSKYFSTAMKAVGSKFFVGIFKDSPSSYEIWGTDSPENELVKLRDTDQVNVLETFDDKVIFNSGYSTFISDGTVDGTEYLSAVKLDGGVVYNDVFYGVGYDGLNAQTGVLFQTDGTEEGTVKIADIGGDLSTMFFGGYSQIPVINDNFILPIVDSSLGTEIGISDRTLSGTHVLRDIRPGSEGSFPRSWVIFNSKVYFIADDGVHGAELWTTDGTSEGTTLVKDTRPGTDNGEDERVIPYPFYQLNDKFYFNASTTAFNSGPPTNIGLYEVKDNMGVTLNYSFGDTPVYLGKSETNLFFYQSGKLIKSDGTSGGTTVVTNVSGSSFFLADSKGNPYTGYFVNNKNIFSVQDPSSGGEYWVTDGTAEGTSILKDINPGTANGIREPIGAVLGNQLIFKADDGLHGAELWITDATNAGTRLLADIYPGAESSYPFAFATAGDKVFFVASDGVHGATLWKTDGTAAGTMIVDVQNYTVSPLQLTALGNSVLYFANNYSGGWVLWKSDGTSAGTTLVKTFTAMTAPEYLTTIGGLVYLSADDGVHGSELWVSDGTPEGTKLLDLVPGAQGSNPKHVTDGGDFAFFSANNQLWVSNGTPEKTMKLGDVEPLQLAFYNNAIYFTGYTSEYGREVYKVEMQRVAQTVTFLLIPTKVIGNDPFLISANASSGLPIQFGFPADKVSVTDSEVTLLKTGSVSIVASQQGDFFTLPASANQVFCINPVKPAISSAAQSAGSVQLQSSSESGNQWFFNGEKLNDELNRTLIAGETGTYSLQVTADNCNSEMSNQVDIVITGLNKESNLTVYPNPATSRINFQTNDSVPMDIEILNSIGQLQDRLNITDKSYDISRYSRGVYLIRIISGDKVSLIKLIKE